MIISAWALLVAGSLTLTEWKAAQCKGERVDGHYFNDMYRFSVTIPADLHGFCCGGATDHGISIPLTRDCSSIIVIYGSYDDVSATTTLATAVTAQAEAFQVPADLGKPLNSRLGALDAASVIVRYRGPAQDVEHVVLAFGPKRKTTFVARLATTATRFAKDDEALGRILSRFRLEAGAE
jgi:hypothetical protein